MNETSAHFVTVLWIHSKQSQKIDLYQHLTYSKRLKLWVTVKLVRIYSKCYSLFEGPGDSFHKKSYCVLEAFSYAAETSAKPVIKMIMHKWKFFSFYIQGRTSYEDHISVAHVLSAVHAAMFTSKAVWSQMNEVVDGTSTIICGPSILHRCLFLTRFLSAKKAKSSHR